MVSDRPPLRSASPTTSPPFDGGEETRASSDNGEQTANAAAEEAAELGRETLANVPLEAAGLDALEASQVMRPRRSAVPLPPEGGKETRACAGDGEQTANAAAEEAAELGHETLANVPLEAAGLDALEASQVMRPRRSAVPLPPEGGEVPRRGGVGEGRATNQSTNPDGDFSLTNRSRRKSGTTKRARSLRQGNNEAEALLWLELKNSQLGGHKFTRQFPIGPYFADFCCRKSRLVVEVDGSHHEGRHSDKHRDAFMQATGFSVLRTWHIDVLRHRIEVLDTILAALNGRLPEADTAELKFMLASTNLAARNSSLSPESLPALTEASS